MNAGRTLLLVDDHHILYRAGTTRVLHPARRHSQNPVIRDREYPWEIALGWCSVARDTQTGRYQLWYQAFSGNLAPSRPLRCVVCYAESDDGLTWHKPDLGLFAYGDIAQTNIVLVGNGGYSDRYGASVLVDPRDPNPDRRYKMSYYDFSVDGGQEYPGLCVAFSPDGIHWTKHPQAPLLRSAYGTRGSPVPFVDEPGRPWDLPLSISDATDVFYDPRLAAFVLYHKMWIDGPDGAMFWKHGMGRTQSSDFINWSRPQLVLTPDERDPEWVEFHHSPVFYADEVYFGLLQILNRGERGGIMDIELAVSRDGVHWTRPFRQPYFLDRSERGHFDSGSLLTNGTPVVDGDEVRFYYGGYSEGATGSDDHVLTTGIGLASVPRHRFAGLRTIGDVGQITLSPLDLSGVQALTVNGDGSHGAIRLELLDPEGRRLPGFSADDFEAIHEDGLALPARWRTATALPPAAMIRIHLERATVYAVTLAG